jgi:hypothetical protein
MVAQRHMVMASQGLAVRPIMALADRQVLVIRRQASAISTALVVELSTVLVDVDRLRNITVSVAHEVGKDLPTAARQAGALRNIPRLLRGKRRQRVESLLVEKLPKVEESPRARNPRREKKRRHVALLPPGRMTSSKSSTD